MSSTTLKVLNLFCYILFYVQQQTKIEQILWKHIERSNFILPHRLWLKSEICKTGFGTYKKIHCTKRIRDKMGKNLKKSFHKRQFLRKLLWYFSFLEGWQKMWIRNKWSVAEDRNDLLPKSPLEMTKFTQKPQHKSCNFGDFSSMRLM